MEATHYSFINGEYVKTLGESQLIVRNKFSNKQIASIPLIGKQEAEAATVAAGNAFLTLRDMSAGERSDLLKKIYKALDEKREFFTDLIVKEAGKPRSYAVSEINRSLETIDAGIRESLTFSGEVIPMDFGSGKGKVAMTKRIATGPVLAFSPFNFPLNLALHKIVPALAAGTSIVLKAPPHAPLTLLAFAELIHKVGAPKGAVNVIVCEPEIAAGFVTDERFSIFSFTGSSAVGWMLKAKAGKKKVLLELGGNAPVIVDETTDLKSAAAQIVGGSFLYAGQICISIQRIYVLEEVADSFIALLIEETKKVKSGNPENVETMNGPLIDTAALKRIEEWMKEAVNGGAKILIGGRVLDKEARIFEPTLITNTKPTMRIFSEEVFGPIAIVERAKSFEAALKMANSTSYGLQAGVYTQLIDRMKQAHLQLEFGGIIINGIPGFRIDHMPYGGVKESGAGREGIRYAMEEMTESRLLIY